MKFQKGGLSVYTHDQKEQGSNKQTVCDSRTRMHKFTSNESNNAVKRSDLHVETSKGRRPSAIPWGVHQHVPACPQTPTRPLSPGTSPEARAACRISYPLRLQSVCSYGDDTNISKRLWTLKRSTSFDIESRFDTIWLHNRENKWTN